MNGIGGVAHGRGHGLVKPTGRMRRHEHDQVPTPHGGPPTATRIPSKRITAAQLEALAARVRTEAPRERMEVEQPFTGGPLGSVPRCTPEDVEAALARARAAQAAWARTSFAERKRVLLRFHDLVLARQDEILDLLQLESGKARKHAFEEVLDVAIVARYYANTAEKHLAHAAAAAARCRCSPPPTSTATRSASSGSSRRGTTRSR